MTFLARDVVEFFGDVPTAAKALRVKERTIERWLERGDVPDRWRGRVEVVASDVAPGRFVTQGKCARCPETGVRFVVRWSGPGVRNGFLLCENCYERIFN